MGRRRDRRHVLGGVGGFERHGDRSPACDQGQEKKHMDAYSRGEDLPGCLTRSSRFGREDQNPSFCWGSPNTHNMALLETASERELAQVQKDVGPRFGSHQIEMIPHPFSTIMDVDVSPPGRRRRMQCFLKRPCSTSICLREGSGSQTYFQQENIQGSRSSDIVPGQHETQVEFQCPVPKRPILLEWIHPQLVHSASQQVSLV